MNALTGNISEKIKQLIRALVSQKNTKAMTTLMLDLCTPAELNAMAERIHVLQFLEKDLSYRQIHEKTGVSLTTIGRVARSLEYGHGGYESLLEKTKK